jgi:hypothetical protein
VESNAHPQPPSDEDKSAVAQAVHGAGDAIQADPSPLATHGRALSPLAPKGRALGALTPEQLHEMRMNTPGLRAIAEAEAQKAAARALEASTASIMQAAAAKAYKAPRRRGAMPYDEDGA